MVNKTIQPFDNGGTHALEYLYLVQAPVIVTSANGTTAYARLHSTETWRWNGDVPGVLGMSVASSSVRSMNLE
jgi:hypothetical protein